MVTDSGDLDMRLKLELLSSLIPLACSNMYAFYNRNTKISVAQRNLRFEKGFMLFSLVT